MSVTGICKNDEGLSMSIVNLYEAMQWMDLPHIPGELKYDLSSYSKDKPSEWSATNYMFSVV